MFGTETPVYCESFSSNPSLFSSLTLAFSDDVMMGIAHKSITIELVLRKYIKEEYKAILYFILHNEFVVLSVSNFEIYRLPALAKMIVLNHYRSWI